MQLTESATLNYSDVFYSFFTNNDCICHDEAVSHFLVYVYSGEMLLLEGQREYSIRAGQCIFIRRDHRLRFTKRPLEHEPFKSISLKFNRNFLRKYFHQVLSEKMPEDARPLESSIYKLPRSPNIESIFFSLIPYFETNEEPGQEMIDLKMQEGVLSLLKIDKDFYPTLFDFTAPWKIDIMDFLQENYMYDLSMQEIASYTGRSLATFKRDFKKISPISPQKWLIQKRLEKARELIHEGGKKVSDVGFDVGFSNRSHFTNAFKKHYGFSPSEDKVRQ